MNLIVLMAMIDDPDELELFCKIIEDYDKDIFSFLLNKVEDYHKAEDLCQEAFVKIAKSITTVSQLEQGRIKSYVYKTALNVYYDYCRLNKSEPVTVDLSEIPDSTADAEATLISKEAFEDLLHIINDLPEACRNVIIMHYLDGLKLKTISKEMDLSIGTVKSYLARGTKLLVERIRNENRND